MQKAVAETSGRVTKKQAATLSAGIDAIRDKKNKHDEQNFIKQKQDALTDLEAEILALQKRAAKLRASLNGV